MEQQYSFKRDQIPHCIFQSATCFQALSLKTGILSFTLVITIAL